MNATAATTQTPRDVVRPGVKIRKDGHMKWTVERGVHMGVIFDEEGMKRGRWAAWSPFAHTPHNMAAFTDDAEAAVDAILATFPVRVAALARELSVSTADVLAEAAALETEWADLGPRAVFAKVPNGASTALTGAAALTVREALAARAAEVATRTPGDVTRPGVTIRKKEFGNSWIVQRDEQEGVIFDEGGAAERGRRWVASSPFATTWRNLVSTTDNPEEAVDAILDTLPALASTVAELTGTTTADVLEEAANLAAEWKDQGRPVFSPKVFDGDAELYGPAVLAIVAALSSRTVEAPAEEPPAEEPAPAVAPQWRTLKGVEVPFLIYGEEREGGHFAPAGDRKRVTGQPLRLVRLWTRGGLRYAEDENGREVYLWGAATKFWTAPAR